MALSDSNGTLLMDLYGQIPPPRYCTVDCIDAPRVVRLTGLVGGSSSAFSADCMGLLSRVGEKGAVWQEKAAWQGRGIQSRETFSPWLVSPYMHAEWLRRMPSCWRSLADAVPLAHLCGTSRLRGSGAPAALQHLDRLVSRGRVLGEVGEDEGDVPVYGYGAHAHLPPPAATIAPCYCATLPFSTPPRPTCAPCRFMPLRRASNSQGSRAWSSRSGAGPLLT